MMYLIFYVSHAIMRQPSDKSYKSVSIKNNFMAILDNFCSNLTAPQGAISFLLFFPCSKKYSWKIHVTSVLSLHSL